MELRAENISKIIHKKTILSNVNLELHNGTVYGFVGANGSGKTMLFRALSGLSIVFPEELLGMEKYYIVIFQSFQVWGFY